uniref:Uncharacterized protein n=1 Tax=Setaria viridis TaxID=4556 RepID=A0A4U6VUI7_SETVI|nr:hypothetical protein SEVIR_7G213850v2 [Setaria viridis]TKW33538.1 hypothetical protein SEVIR_2G243450v2 [Setaria viridis]
MELRLLIYCSMLMTLSSLPPVRPSYGGSSPRFSRSSL